MPSWRVPALCMAMLVAFASPPVLGQSAQYQLSVFMLGSVQRPGEYPFVRGMTVLQAVALAGGYYRGTDVGQRPERDAAIALGDLRILVAKRAQLGARQLRLESERDELKDLRPTPSGGDAKDLAKFLPDERALMTARSKTFADDVARLREQIALLNDEIKSLDATKQAEDRERASVSKELVDVRGLVSNSLVPAPRQYLLERGLAEIDSKEGDIGTNVARARQSISRTEQNIVSLTNQRKENILSELQSTHRDMDEVEARIATTRQVLTEAESLAPGGFGRRLSGNEPRPSFSLLRNESGTVQERSVGENALLQPGDIVRVQTLDPQQLTGADAMPGPAPAGATQTAVGAARSLSE